MYSFNSNINDKSCALLEGDMRRSNSLKAFIDRCHFKYFPANNFVALAIESHFKSIDKEVQEMKYNCFAIGEKWI